MFPIWQRPSVSVSNENHLPVFQVLGGTIKTLSFVSQVFLLPAETEGKDVYIFAGAGYLPDLSEWRFTHRAYARKIV